VILRCCATVAVILGVLMVPDVADAGPITYSFSARAGHCEPALICVDAWDGVLVTGQFTLDTSVPTLTAFSFGSFDVSGQLWLGPTFPDPTPGDSFVPSFSLSSSASGTLMEFRETVLLAPPEAPIVYLLNATFGSPLSAFDSSTFTGGSIARQSPQAISNPLVPGVVQVVPEPSSIFLFGTGVVSIGTWRKRLRIGTRLSLLKDNVAQSRHLS